MKHNLKHYIDKLFNGSIRLRLLLLIMCTVLFIWAIGLVHSPLFQPDMYQEKSYVSRYLAENAPDFQAERALAKSYWLRYQDVRDDPYYGEDGIMGLAGAREHFKQHGRREGRIYAEVIEPEDPALEQQLAEAYWLRYPDIASSTIWGRKSSLGIRGPRDHYRHFGKQNGYLWGLAPDGGGTGKKAADRP